MACEVKVFAQLKDFNKVQEYFGLAHDDAWFNAVNYAIAPTGDLLVLAHGEKLAFLCSCMDSRAQINSFSLSWCGELEDGNQIVTALACIPFYGKHASYGTEWICVAVGLSSGMVVFYSESGSKIFSQSFNDEAVLSIKLHSSATHSESDCFYINYSDCLCLIKGIDVYTMLSNLKHHLERISKRQRLIDSNTKSVEVADLLHFQKYKFERHRETVINDAVVVGKQSVSSFDHIVEQCHSSGYYARVNDTPVQSCLVIGVGAEPYLGFYYAEEGYRTISMGAVAKDIIGQAYKNIWGNLFKRTPTEPQAEEIPSPSKELPMRTRARLYDGKRDGFTIALAPGGRLAAVTDNLDRVMLVDAQAGIILRVWKGYRDAQCAFVPIKEKTMKGVVTHRRKALFLIIYAPRLGCLEIWALQNGPKVAAFTVSKSGQLAYNEHTLLGQQIGVKSKVAINHCLFIDPADASIKEVEIPFHFALSESNSGTSRDIHLLRQLKQALREEISEMNCEEINEICKKFQTIEVRQQCLEMLKKNKQLNPTIFRIIVYAFDESLHAQEDASLKSDDFCYFTHQIENYKHLVDFYLTMKSPIECEFNEFLELTDSDLVIINQLVLLLGKSGSNLSPLDADNMSITSALTMNKVTFSEDCKESDDFAVYLSIFQTEQKERIPLLPAQSHLYGLVSCRLFNEFFDRGLCFDKFKLDAEQSNIPSEDLLVLVLHFWLDKPFSYQNCDEVIEDMSRLAAMVTAICEMAGNCTYDYAYNDISIWWQRVREMLLESPNSLSLLVGIICKTVAAQLRRKFREGSCDEGSQTEEDDCWEKISHDQAQWALLIAKLEDIAVLGAILEYPITSLEPVMPKMTFKTPDCSLKCIVNAGKGVVTDLTAQWLILSQIHPTKVLEAIQKENSNEIDNGKKKKKTQKASSSKNKQQELANENKESDLETDDYLLDVAALTNCCTDPVLAKLALLRAHYPFSLESGVLLSLMAWHYMVHWSKNLTSLEHMRASLVCLEQFREQDLALKHGICCLLWNATLKFPLQSTLKLIHKVGRLPKDKMCQQDIELSATLVPDFLQMCLEFLNHFATSLEHNERELQFEESLIDGPMPLQQIALQQPLANKQLLKLQYEICSVLHFIAFFQLKVHKPMTRLFDAVSNKAFFADINKELPFVLISPDIVLQKQRQEFLCNVISASMDLIREDTREIFVQEHLQIVQRVNALADSWFLGKSALRKQQIIEMYAHGYDKEAEKLLSTLDEDDDTIGIALLEIAGKRLNIYTQVSKQYYLKVAAIGTSLLQYLDNLKENSANHVIQISTSNPKDINIDLLTKLCIIVLNNLSKHESKYLQIAAQMFDACSVLSADVS